MKPIQVVQVLAVLAWLTASLPGEEPESAVAYNEINLLLKVVEGRKVDGVDCAPLYLKPAKEGERIDAKKANFRIRTWEGGEEPLKVAVLSKVLKQDLTTKDKVMIADGFTHILWVPRGAKRFLDGEIVASLPKGSMTFSQFIGLSGSIRIGEGENREEAEQGGAGQPATRSESDSEGGDKPQPESEERSR